MNQKELKQLLETYKAGEISEDDVLLKLKEAPYEDLGFAKLDRHRALRQGQAEVIYGAGKTGEQIRLLAERAWQDRQKTILVTRMNQEKKDLIAASNPPMRFITMSLPKQQYSGKFRNRMDLERLSSQPAEQAIRKLQKKQC